MHGMRIIGEFMVLCQLCKIRVYLTNSSNRIDATPREKTQKAAIQLNGAMDVPMRCIIVAIYEF